MDHEHPAGLDWDEAVLRLHLEGKHAFGFSWTASRQLAELEKAHAGQHEDGRLPDAGADVITAYRSKIAHNDLEHRTETARLKARTVELYLREHDAVIVTSESLEAAVRAESGGSREMATRLWKRLNEDRPQQA